MTREFTRRRIVGFIFGAAAAFAAPVALGWRQLIAEAGGKPAPRMALTPQLRSDAPLPSIPPNVTATQVGPAEEVTLIGVVDKVLGDDRFVGSSSRLSGVTVDLSVASPIYPRGHVPVAGDDFASRGRWLGDLGTSIWQVQFIDYNIRSIRGQLFPTSVDAEATYSLKDMGTGVTWLIVFRATEIDHFTRSGAAVEPSASSLNFAPGTSVRLIGYEDRPGVIVVTFIESEP
jgi:hypothetical protein